MAELVIVDDPNTELAVIVDVDDFRPLAIVGAGPHRVNLLQSFVDTMPFDVSLLNEDDLRMVFGGFLESAGALDTMASNTDTADTVGASTRNGDDAKATLAETEAHNTSDVPDTQSADTDTPEDPAPAKVVVQCWNCGGTGNVVLSESEPPRECGVCSGTGRVLQVVAS